MSPDSTDFTRIRIATVAALALHAGVGILSAVLMGMSGDFSANLNHPVQFLGLGTGLLAGVVFLVWVSRAHALARTMCPSKVKSGPFWAVAGFFVPLLNLVHPYRVVSDIWRTITGTHVGPVRVWWFATLALLLIPFAASKLIDPSDRIYLQVAGGVTSAALCIMTAYVVWRIGRGGHAAPTGATA